MADHLGISEAQILGLFLSSTFWGMFLITFFYCMRHLLWDAKGDLRPMRSVNWPMFCVAMLLAFFSTFDVALGLMHAIEAFIFYTGPGGSDARFTGLTDWVNILKTCNVVFGKLISDGVLVYRCWIIYNRSWLTVALPILLWCGYLALSIFVIYLEASASNSDVLLTGGLSSLTPSITAGWTMSIVNNIFVTGLIVWRITRVDRENSRYAIQTASDGSRNRSLFRFGRNRTKLQNVTRIIIESGFMYTAIAFMTFITFLVNSNSFYPTSDAELQILSIAFNLIIIRISTRPAENFDLKSSALHPPTFPLRNFNTTMTDGAISGGDITTKRTLEVMVTNERDVESDYAPETGRSYAMDEEDGKSPMDEQEGASRPPSRDIGSAV